jgi:hypothetical protein
MFSRQHSLQTDSSRLILTTILGPTEGCPSGFRSNGTDQAQEKDSRSYQLHIQKKKTKKKESEKGIEK